jgi:hypothetical protein
MKLFRSFYLLAFCFLFCAVIPHAGAQSLPQKDFVAQEIARGDLTSAHDDLAAVLAAHPQSAAAWYLLSVDDRRRGDLGDASAALAHAKAIDPAVTAASRDELNRLEADLNTPSPSRPRPVEHRTWSLAWAIAAIASAILLLSAFLAGCAQARARAAERPCSMLNRSGSISTC